MDMILRFVHGGPLAEYRDGVVYINRDLFEVLSEKDQMFLLYHEYLHWKMGDL